MLILRDRSAGFECTWMKNWGGRCVKITVIRDSR